MHIPSYKVHQEMINEPASVWYVPANEGTELAILIKAPTPSLKALISGCSLKLLFGIDRPFLCTGAMIFDVPDAPIIISGIQRDSEEHEALVHFLSDRSSTIFLFNEMDICVAWSKISITEQDAKSAFDFLDDISTLYVGPFKEEMAHTLDCFCYSLDSTANYPNAKSIPILSVDVTLESWKTIKSFFYEKNHHAPINISNHNEGEAFEDTIWATLTSVFPNSLYKNPVICNGQKKREFTDIFAFHEYGSFLIEAKDLSVLQAGYTRSQTRRISGIQKQVKKAITQLIGACKDFSDNKEIYGTDNTLIQVNRTTPPHCIVLITELTPVGNWDEITNLIYNAIQETGAFFHLLDLQEFITLLKGSSGNSALFDYNLIERCKLFLDTKSVFIRSQPPEK